MVPMYANIVTILDIRSTSGKCIFVYYLNTRKTTVCIIGSFELGDNNTRIVHNTHTKKYTNIVNKNERKRKNIVIINIEINIDDI